MKKRATSKQLRIIGGIWRSRKIIFREGPGLRPTADRVRETLFNWLSPMLPSARCLDLFAGSGVLGFEALSRGAAHVTLVDTSVAVIEQLHANCVALNTQAATIIQATIPAKTLTFAVEQPFDIIFIDPPFRKNLIASTCSWLDQQPWLAPNAWIYIETEHDLKPLPIPSHWECFREKQAGDVAYYLIQRQVIENSEASASR